MNSRLEYRKAPRIASLVLAAVLNMAGWVDGAHAQQYQPGGDVEVVQVRPNVYMIVGGGSNILVHLGWMGAVLVDTGTAAMSDRVLAAIKRLTDKRIRFIINTTADADHVGGNEALSKAGRTLLLYSRNGSGFSGSDFQTNAGAAGTMAHESVLSRMSAPSGQKTPFPSTAWPTETYTGARIRSIYLNNDGIQLIYQPAAHSDADSIVFFRRADVIVAATAPSPPGVQLILPTGQPFFHRRTSLRQRRRLARH